MNEPPSSSDDRIDNRSEEPASGGVSLRFRDAICIVVGIVVGTAVFKSPQVIFNNTSGPWQALGLWAIGGALSVLGAFCYAELATTYPRMGGDYEYQRRAFGPGAGFLFGWAQLTVVSTSAIGSMAYAFADYSETFFTSEESVKAWIGAGLIAALTAINGLGVVVGKATQNVLTVAKVVGLAMVVGAALFVDIAPTEEVAQDAPESISIGLALVFVLYAYGGWSDAAFIAAEVRDRRRNLPRTLIGGVVAITLIYLAVNAAYLWALGFDGARATGTPASEVLQQAIGPRGAQAVSVLVMISALGAINGMIFTSPRVYTTLGKDFPALGWLGRWDHRRSAPVAGMVAQASISIAMTLLVGTTLGRSMIDRVFTLVGIGPLPWEEYYGGFETLVAAAAPVFWVFLLATGLSFFVLRWKDPHSERPFQAPLFPLAPLLFCGMCGYMLYSSLNYARWLAALGAAPVLVGACIYLLVRNSKIDADAAS